MGGEKDRQNNRLDDSALNSSEIPTENSMTLSYAQTE